MGQSVSADAEPSELKDLLALGQGLVGQDAGRLQRPRALRSPPDEGGSEEVFPARHHVKAWRFFEGRTRGITADVPVALREALTGAERSAGSQAGASPSREPQRTSSYLVLHVRTEGAGQEQVGDSCTLQLEEMAARASAACTPRGLALEATATEPGARPTSAPPEPSAWTDKAARAATSIWGNASPASPRSPPDAILQGGGEGQASHMWTVFVWHGQAVEPLVKAQATAKAYELDRLLQLGLLRQPGLQASLRQAVAMSGGGGARQPRGESAPSEHRFLGRVHSEGEVVDADLAGAVLSAAESVRRSRNKLLTDILEPPPFELQELPPMTSRRSLAAPVANVTSHRFPRLGLSVGRSLGLSLAAVTPTGAPSAVPASSSSAPPPPLVLPSVSGNPGEKDSASQGAAGVQQPQKPFVPRLALGSLLGRGTAPGPVSAAEPMQVAPPVDSPGDSGGRKRIRAPEGQPQTARGAGSGAARAAPELLPKSARLEPAPPQPAYTALTPVPPVATQQRSSLGQPARGVPGLALGLGEARANVPAPSGRTPRGQTPAALNLEELNMSEEEMINSFDPNNEENNYHLPHHLCKRLQMDRYRGQCSEVLPGALYISSYAVASNLEALKERQITHIVNTAADVCDNHFPDQFQYTTYYLNDTNHEDISVLFYRTMELIHTSISKGGRVLVHCREGISRSATMCIAYMMWRQGMSFEAAHDKIRQTRPVCNPNAGFTCRLLLLGKKLALASAPDGSPPDARSLAPSPADERPQLFRVVPHHPKEPFLLLLPVEWPQPATQRQRQADPRDPPWPVPPLDPRFGFVVQQGASLILWIGGDALNAEAVTDTVQQHTRRLEVFESLQCTLAVVRQGSETPQWWQALGLPRAPEGGPQALAAPRPEWDADFEVIRSVVHGRAAPATAREGAAAAGAEPPEASAYSSSDSSSAASEEEEGDRNRPRPRKAMYLSI